MRAPLHSISKENVPWIARPPFPSLAGPSCYIESASDSVEREQRPPNRQFLHAQEQQGLWIYTIAGAAEFQIGERSHHLTEGTLFALRSPNPGSILTHKKDLPWSRVYLAVRGEIGLRLFEFLCQRHGMLYTLPPASRCVSAARQLARAVAAGRLDAHELSSRVFAWLHLWWRDAETHAPQLSDFDRHPGDPARVLNFEVGTLKRYAERMGYSTAHLSRQLKQVWGASPGAHMRRKRLDHAALLLKSTSLSVADAAARVGYRSVSAFCHAFRQQFGVTPLSFRHTDSPRQGS